MGQQLKGRYNRKHNRGVTYHTVKLYQPKEDPIAKYWHDIYEIDNQSMGLRLCDPVMSDVPEQDEFTSFRWIRTMRCDCISYIKFVDWDLGDESPFSDPKYSFKNRNKDFEPYVPQKIGVVCLVGLENDMFPNYNCLFREDWDVDWEKDWNIKWV